MVTVLIQLSILITTARMFQERRLHISNYEIIQIMYTNYNRLMMPQFDESSKTPMIIIF